MTEINVKSSSNEYTVSIGESIRFNLKKYVKKEYSSIMIITDDTVAKLYLADVTSNFSEDRTFNTIIPTGETSKSMDWFHKLQTEAIKNGLDRKSLIIALGGGVVGDLAGFVAATFLRGIDYIQIPTTILAHDSSVGGKVAINHNLGKNLIGCFYPPTAVIYDVETLQTLTANEVRSGYAELVKEALIADQEFLSSILQTNLASLPPSLLKEHLWKGIKVKASIVESDEREAGIRMYLNLGHTLGHALEAELGYGFLTHGEAVAIGLLFALRVSEKVYPTSSLPYESLYNWLKENQYPLELTNLNTDSLLDKMMLDKKVVNKKIQMVLLKKVGEPTVLEISNETLLGYLNSFIEELVKK